MAMFVGLRVVARPFGRMRCWTMASTSWAFIDAMATIPSMQAFGSRRSRRCCEFFNYLKACFHFHQKGPIPFHMVFSEGFSSLAWHFGFWPQKFPLPVSCCTWELNNWRSKGRRGDACITRRNQQRTERRGWPGCWIRFRIRMLEKQAETYRNLQDEGIQHNQKKDKFESLLSTTASQSVCSVSSQCLGNSGPDVLDAQIQQFKLKGLSAMRVFLRTRGIPDNMKQHGIPSFCSSFLLPKQF